MKKLKNLIVTALVVALALGTLSAAAFAEGSSVFKITARVKGKGGTVAVNGGTPGKTATTYCADNCSVNLTAIPDDGYEFDKWVDAKGETVSTYVPSACTAFTRARATPHTLRCMTARW